MAFKLVSLVSAVTFLISFKINATEDQSLKETHKSILKSQEHLTVQFDQKIYRKMRNKITQRTGIASFSKPNMFLWTFDDKKNQEKYYFNGTTLSHFQTSDQSVTHYSTKNSFAKELQDVVDLVLDTEKLFTRYSPKIIESQKDFSRINLIPTSKNPTDVSKIEVKILTTKSFIEEINVEYQDGNYTYFTFKNPNNKPIDPKTFVYSKPQGATNVKEKVFN
ncbi:MAG: outer membrane lipoprotein carrier protein LolA [Oligoflexales bacterium]|nr:outer membrane lipoprotein carrier protein LolA [Oligoflexales bacterium]